MIQKIEHWLLQSSSVVGQDGQRPEATLTLERQHPEGDAQPERSDGEGIAILVRNIGRTLAFFTRLRLLTATGAEVLPAHFGDNYISLLPGEALLVAVRDARSGEGSKPAAALIEATGPRQARVTLPL